MSILPQSPRQMAPQSKMGCLTRLVLVLIVVGAVMAGATYLFSPWAFYMGGPFHWLPWWSGVGRMHSDSGGGDYAIYVWFWPDHGKFRQLAYVQGRAMVCTPRGERFNLTLGGDFVKPDGVWRLRDLNGTKVSLYMFNRTAKHIFGGASPRPELKLQGRWQNPDLVLDDDSSIQRNFDHNASLRTSLTGVPYKGEVSTVTLREGGKNDFDAACAAVKTR
jgi:hypothetical protein